MIFLTLGTQLPFERLVKAVDEWAKIRPECKVFAQVGNTEYKPKHMEVVASLSPNEYKKTFDESELVISHVGMGTIIQGLSCGKQMILMPRSAELGEHRNDHQLATAKKFEHFENVNIVYEAEQFNTEIDRILNEKSRYASADLKVSESLIGRIEEFMKTVRENIR